MGYVGGAGQRWRAGREADRSTRSRRKSMFTVKVVTQRGTEAPASDPQARTQTLGPLATEEVVFEASQVRMARDGKLVSVELGEGEGVQEVRGDVAGAEPVGHIYCDTESGQIVYNIRATVAANEPDQIIYVMNRFGATVAKYFI
jgi:hypothetical protein